MADDLFTQDVVREFILMKGGRVTNHELVSHFKLFLNDTSRKVEHRQKFKDYVNTLATIKLDPSGEKVLVLKKQFRDVGRSEGTPSTPAEDRLANKDHIPKRKEKLPPKRKESLEEPTPMDIQSAEEPVCEFGSDPVSKEVSPAPEVSAPQPMEVSPPEPDLMSESIIQGAPEFVSAVAAREEERAEESSVEMVQADQSNVISASEREVSPEASSVSTVSSDTFATPHNSRESSVSPEEESQPGQTPMSVKERAQHLNKISSTSDIHHGQTKKKHSKLDKTGDRRDDDDSHAYESISLNTLDREWLVASAKADYQRLARILNNNPHYARRKDFTSGYTAVHWAAKHGNADVVKMICGTAGAQVNARSHGGYTALHIAAMHGNEEIIEILTKTYNADPNIRDYSGKKPKQYLQNSASTKVQQLLATKLQSSVGSGSLQRSGSYRSRIQQSHMLGAAVAGMRSSWSWGMDGDHLSRSQSPSPVASPTAHRKSSLPKDSDLMPPPVGVPLRRKRSTRSQGREHLSDSELNRAESDPNILQTSSFV